MRVLDFSDGFTSSSAPSITNVEAASLKAYANDAAFVSAEGTAGNGDIYYNTTAHIARYYRNGTWVNIDSKLVTGSRASPTAVVAGTGVVASTVNEIKYIQGSGGAVDISANPQISAGTFVGQELTLVGRSDTNTVLLEHGDGLELNGSCTLIAGSMIKLVYDGTMWTEESRNDL